MRSSESTIHIDNLTMQNDPSTLCIVDLTMWSDK